MRRNLLFTIVLIVGVLGICPAQDMAFVESGRIKGSKQQTTNPKVPLTSALTKLAEKHDIYFSYDLDVLRKYQVPIAVSSGAGLEGELKQILKGTKLRYKKVSEKSYVVFEPVEKQKNKISTQPSSEPAKLQERRENLELRSSFSTPGLIHIPLKAPVKKQVLEVKGLVSDEEGLPMIGVNIVLKKSPTTGTITDIDGMFRLEVASLEETLIFSYTGYQSQEVEINGRTEVDLTMQPDLKTLDEVVVVGFGTQKKRFTTGAISKVSSKELENISQSTIEGSLQGKIAGVQVTASDAMAGSPVTIRIRGTSSIVASSEPLYVVDGVPVVSGNFSYNNASSWRLATAHESNALAQLNPADIESIEILKDASAAAIYGSRGANGVVLITTKRGKEGRTKFDVSYQSGFSKETNRIEMLDGPTYLSLAKEAWANSDADAQVDDNPRNDNRYSTANDFEKFWAAILPPGLTREVAENTNTDWIDYALQQGQFNEASLSASGGNAKTTFYIGGTYRDEQGIFVGNHFQRSNARVNLDHKPTDNISIGARMAYTVTDNDIIPISWAGGLGTAQSQALPFWPVFNEDGTYFNARSGNNVAAELANTDMNQRGTSILGNVYGQIKFWNDFTVRSEFGVNNIYKKERYYRSAIIEPNALATSVLSESINWNINNTLSYSKSIGSHAIDVLAGMNATRNEFFTNIIDGENFPNPALTNPENAAIQTASIATSQFAFLSFLGRLNYRFKEKYLVSASIRRDGSSRFGRANRWGTFPAISLGWIISDESILSGNKTLTFLKLRASYGQTGNAEIGNFEYFGSFRSSNYVDLPGIIVEEIDNDQLGWESTQQYDIGLDFGLWEGRIEGGIDFYLKETTDLLTEVDVSALSGVERVTSNIGSLENKGFDFSLNAHNLTGAFKWVTSINLAYNQNRITDLGGRNFIPGQAFGLGAVGVGFPVGARFLVEWAGIAPSDRTAVVTDPETMSSQEIQIKGGDILYINQFGEVTNIYDPNDQKFMGNPTPVWTGGVTNSFSYKGLDISVLFTFASGHDLANEEQQYQYTGFGFGWNMWADATNRWQEQGDQTNIQRLTWGPERNYYSRFVRSADFVRLKDVTIGYNLPKRWLNKFGFNSLRVFAKGTNIATFTDYPGWDPEYNRDGAGNVGQGKSWLPSPQAKSVSFGLNASF